MLAVFSEFPDSVFRLDATRILDFFMLFPNELRNTRLPQSSRSLLPELRTTKYNMVPNRVRIFYQLHPIQNAALNHLVKSEFVQRVSTEQSKGYKRSNKPVPIELQDRMIAWKNIRELRPILEGYLLKLSVTGKDGLKGRSRLYNVTYDAA